MRALRFVFTALLGAAFRAPFLGASYLPGRLSAFVVLRKQGFRRLSNSIQAPPRLAADPDTCERAG